MSTETFKKRQKELARKEKRQKKQARRLERAQEKAKGETDSPELSNLAEPLPYQDPTISSAGSSNSN